MHPILRRWYAWYGRSPRRHRYDGLDLIVLPGVFHPGLFFSTRVLTEHIVSMELRGRTFLDLGAGSGLVALAAARMGANVTASDIAPAAIRNLEQNSERNDLPLHIVRSDLFAHLHERFDVIAINPPYYAKDPLSQADRAFFAGKDLDYFTCLFPALSDRVKSGTKVLMVLSGDLDLAPIASRARQAGLQLVDVHRKKRWGEEQVIFDVVELVPCTPERR
ncbi:MAG: methyltransferase [Flavobacteriales bacterium]|nr:methyltransferase [Flavobacteriales bacterium]MCB9166165.1 methyltransferase [Flavobacteriales bacterium]